MALTRRRCDVGSLAADAGGGLRLDEAAASSQSGIALALLGLPLQLHSTAASQKRGGLAPDVPYGEGTTERHSALRACPCAHESAGMDAGLLFFTHCPQLEQGAPFSLLRKRDVVRCGCLQA